MVSPWRSIEITTPQSNFIALLAALFKLKHIGLTYILVYSSKMAKK